MPTPLPPKKNKNKIKLPQKPHAPQTHPAKHPPPPPRLLRGSACRSAKALEAVAGHWAFFEAALEADCEAACEAACETLAPRLEDSKPEKSRGPFWVSFLLFWFLLFLFLFSWCLVVFVFCCFLCVFLCEPGFPQSVNLYNHCRLQRNAE